MMGPFGRLTLALLLAIAGMAVHTIVEFGIAGLWAFGTGMVPWTLLQGTLWLVWWRRPAARRATAMALFGTALVQLIGGAIVSVLPLPWLPFEPEQSVPHYLSHGVLGVAQLPLLHASWRSIQDAG